MSAQYEGRELALGQPRRRALLALLLIRLGRVVPTELLIDELWGNDPPQQPVATLQSHISQLRRVLDRAAAGRGEPSVLRYRAPGYVLQLAPEQVDVHCFEHLVSAGRTLLDQRDPLAARDRLTEALRLWHGAPYTEFSAHPPLIDETARLEQVRLTAVEFCAEAGLSLGAADDVAAALGTEVRRHPIRERLVGHLMTALSRLGRQAEALELYERTRGRLVEEFGVDTAVELQRVHTAILRQEPGACEPSHEPIDEPPETSTTEVATPGRAPLEAGTAEPASGVCRAGATPFGGSLSSSAPFVGRGQELRRLSRAATAAATGQGHVACVLGSAGTGKTRLLLELRSRLEGPEAELEVVTSQCFPGEGVSPYWLWTQVLRRLSAARPDAFRAAAAPFGALLAPLLPEQAAGRAPAEMSEVLWPQARFRTHDAVCEVLFALAAQRPLVLLVEDLHWADMASLDLLRLLCSRSHSSSLSIVLSVRDQGPAGESVVCRTVTEILKGPRTEMLLLGGLSLDAVAALVGAQAGPGVEAEVVRTLHQRSNGNPYFVVQFLSHLGDARLLHDQEAAGILLAQIPVGVREVLRRHLSTLEEPVSRVLRLCAVIGTEVDTDLLSSTAAADEPVAAALDTAIREGVLSEDPLAPGRLSFTHALVQETLIDELSREERQNLHARAAQELSVRGRARTADRFGDQEDEEAERIAHHIWHAKDAVPAPWALPRLVRAAERAEHHRAYEQVETWLRRAAHVINALPPDDVSVSLLEQRLYIQLGRVLALTRGYGDHEAEAALRRGRALNAVTHAPEDPSVLLTLCATQLVTGHYEEARHFSGLLRTIAATTDDPLAVLGAPYGEGVILHIRGQLPEALAELERGIEAADRYAREGRTWRRALQVRAPVSLGCYETFTRWLLGDRDGAAEGRLRLLRLTEYDDPGPAERAFALYVNAVIAAWEGDADTAHTSSAQGARLAAEHGLPYWQAMLGIPQGWALAHSGYQDQGIALMRESLTGLDRSRTRIRLPLHLGLLGQAQEHAGRREDAEATLRRMVAIIELRQEHVYLHPALPTTGLLHELLGHRATETIRTR
ncbi:BTAD domain-containing putative transcriptional regulator [Streptomyces niveus]|uniref:BTAD domain-containing putative transcriptional regulator n=1 Tax=Streptomyces niveus TaxID=193462 RepID=UPI0036581C8A